MKKSLLVIVACVVIGSLSYAQINLSSQITPKEVSVFTPTLFYNHLNEKNFSEDYGRALRKQRALKGWGIFNISWGGLWVVGGTYFLAKNSGPPEILAPILIGGAAAVLGVIRVKRANKNIRAIKEKINLQAGTNGVGNGFHGFGHTDYHRFN